MPRKSTVTPKKVVADKNTSLSTSSAEVSTTPATSEIDTLSLQEQVDKNLLNLMNQGISQFTSSISKINSLSEKLLSHFEKQVNYVIDADSANLDVTATLLEKVQNKQIQILDLIRKIAQGKQITQTKLSYEERVVVQLFNSFTSKAEKSKFLHLVETQLGEQVQYIDDSADSTSIDYSLEFIDE